MDISNSAAPKLRRRIAPVVIALTGTGIAVYPSLTNMMSNTTWLRWTLLSLAIFFAFKSCLFLYMRQTMVDQTRKLTIFGCALVDFFASIVVADLLLVYLFLGFYFSSRNGGGSSFGLRFTSRAGLIGACILTISTGLIVAYEMRRAKGQMRVHQEDLFHDRHELGEARG